MKIVSFKICPFVHRVTALLEAKNISYELEFISLNDKPQWFLDISPNGQVPVLITDNKDVLFESDAIVEYLEEAYPALHPDISLEEKAKNRAWSYLASKHYLWIYQLRPRSPKLCNTSPTVGDAFTTYATIATCEKGDDWVDGLLDYLQGTVDAISEFLATSLPAVNMIPVEGTYQVWLDCSATGLDGDALKSKLGTSGFGATPGSWFDADATQFIRINIAAPRAEIMTALERFAETLNIKEAT